MVEIDAGEEGWLRKSEIIFQVWITWPPYICLGHICSKMCMAAWLWWQHFWSPCFWWGLQLTYFLAATSPLSSSLFLHITWIILAFPYCPSLLELSVSMTFDWELAVMHTTPSMFSKFLVHAWRYCGGLHREHSILVHLGSNSFWHAKRC